MRILPFRNLKVAVLLFFAATAHGQESDSLHAARYFEQGVSFMKMRHRDSAVFYIEKSRAKYKEVNSWEGQVKCLNQLSEIYTLTGSYDKALESARGGLALCEKNQVEFHEQTADVFNNFGAVYYFTGEYVQALESYLKALAIQLKVYGNVHPQVANSYNFMGILYFEMGNSVQALDYHQRSLNLRRKIFGEHHPHIGYSYNNIGIIYRRQGKYDLAMECYTKALSIAKEFRGERHVDYASCLSNVGNVYADQREYKKALAAILKACDITRELLGEVNYEITIGYVNLVKIYQGLGEPAKAKEYLFKVLDIRKKVYGPKHSTVARAYNALGDWYFEQHAYTDALENFQLAMVSQVVPFNAMSYASNPSINDCARYPAVLFSLEKKAKTLAMIDDLEHSFQTYQRSDSLMTKARGARFRQEDKLNLGKISHALYQGGIDVCMKLYGRSNEKRYIEEAFYFSERSKAGILSEALANAVVRETGLVSKEIVAKEGHLQAEVSRLQSILSSFKTSPGKNAAAIDHYRDSLNVVNGTLDSLMDVIQTQYPDYYRLVYGGQVVRLPELQKVLPAKTALFEFYEGDETVYIFYVDATQYEVYTTPNDSLHQSGIHQLLTMLKRNTDLLSNKEYTQFTTEAHALYKKLLEPVTTTFKTTADRQTHWVIIPDGQLSFLSFDILLTKPAPSGAANFASLDYLIKEHSIGYGYSASILFGKHHRVTKNPNLFLSYGPSYTLGSPDSSSILLAGKFRDAVTALKWNQDEARQLSEQLGGKYFVGKEATELSFKREAQTHQIIHLAMHAFSDDEDPMNSKLIFATDSASSEDGYLHAFELYNMHLNAELVVLSACNTGVGKLNQGEGVMSLARAFTYAGVPSLVMSRWNVDDETTNQLMQYFYKNLNQGMNKSEALQQAKISFLENCLPGQAHPFYWSSFSLIGEDESIDSTRTILPWVISIAVALMLLTLFWLWKKRSASI
jgi:CHAT domain-containing protein/Tfp pilus assembly protein PilF